VAGGSVGRSLCQQITKRRGISSLTCAVAGRIINLFHFTALKRYTHGKR
jgi:hypothetical protein